MPGKKSKIWKLSSTYNYSPGSHDPVSTEAWKTHNLIYHPLDRIKLTWRILEILHEIALFIFLLNRFVRDVRFVHEGSVVYFSLHLWLIEFASDDDTTTPVYS